MALRNYTGESGANAAATHTINIPDGSNVANFKSLTVSTYGADIGADVKIAITDGGRERWVAYLRSAKVFGEHFVNIGNIILANSPSTLQITTTGGGGSCIVVVSCVVEALVNPNARLDEF